MNNSLIYTVKEVAKLLHSSPNYVYSLIEMGYLPAIKLGSIKVRKDALENFLVVNEGNDLSDLNNVKKLSLKGADLRG
jgi:conserved domain protein